ncbi:MAG TPA: hypothetical protein VGM39_22185 [Kofleriaceae bacterium]|jgi:hypothetical protein
MSAIDRMLGLLGAVRLKDYGLVRTPEDRILSIRRSTLDDGLGGRIVGWRDTDLAPAELQPFGAPKAPAKRPQFPSAAYPIVPQPAAPAVPVAAATPIARLAVVPPPVAVPRPVVVAPRVVTPPPVAAAPVVEEDDWEWTIAIARARAAAEWAEEAALVAQVAISDLSDTGTFTQVEALPLPTMSNVQALAPVTATVPRIELAPQKPARARATMPPPLGIPTPPHAVPALPRVETRPQVSRTVIPVPTLATTTVPRNLAPVVRSPVRQMPHPIPPAQPRRFAKGTGPMLPTTKALDIGDDTTPNLNVGDETVPAIYAAPAASATLPRVVARK